MKLAEAITKKNQLDEDLKALQVSYENEKKRLLAKRDECTRAIKSEKLGIDYARTKRAEKIITVGGSYARGGEDRAFALSTAMTLLTTTDGRHQLSERYVGTKNYDRWCGQYVNPPHGMAPTHGYMVFLIEMTEPTRKRIIKGDDLTPEEIEDALYLLSVIEEWEKSKEREA